MSCFEDIDDMPHRGPILILFILWLGMSGCAVIDAKPKRAYETVSGMPQRDSVRARKLNNDALELLEQGNLGEARAAVDQAIIADIDHAPAHNTLGKIYFRQGNYYLAAWEFEFAIRLYPDFPDYHNNLGLVYEEAGKLPDAIEQFQLAVDLKPDNYHFVSNLARAKIRTDEKTPETRRLLEQVVFMDPRREWKNWARAQMNTTHLDIPAAELPIDNLHPHDFSLPTDIVLPPKFDSQTELTPSPQDPVDEANTEAKPETSSSDWVELPDPQ